MSERFKVETFDTREAWLKAREHSIGGSEVAAVTGLSKYESPFSLWARKTGKIQPEPETLIMRVGHAVEPLIHSELETHGYTLRDPGLTIVRSVERPYLHASPDRFVVREGVDAGIAEFKSGGSEEGWEDEPRADALVQTQWALLLTGYEVGVIAALIGSGRSFKVYPQGREVELQAVLLEKVDEFWHRHILADIPPAVDWMASTKAALSEMYPKDTGEEISLPAEDWRESLAKLSEIKLRQENDKLTQAEIENRLRLALGDATSARIEGVGRVSWKLQKRKAYTVKESEFRVLRVTEEK